MQFKKIFLSSLLVLLLGSCASNKTINKELKGQLKMLDDSYEITTNYNSDVFFSNATVYNQDLVELSLSLVYQADEIEVINPYLKEMGFTNTCNYGYDSPSVADKSTYTISTLNINDTNIVALTFKCLDYKAEWANNFLLGLDGNHQGFEACAREVYDTLKQYISNNNISLDKLWISGFSRGGALSNVLSYLILENNTLDIKKENMFVYTFDAPKGLLKENAKPYENVFNLINPNDVITYIVPEEFGFARCGIDIELSSTTIDEDIKAFDENFVLEPFKANEQYYSSESELAKLLISKLVTNKNGTLEGVIKDRQTYSSTFEEPFRYLAKLGFSLNKDTLLEILNVFKENIFNVLLPDGAFNLIDPILQENHVTYDQEALKTHLSTLINGLVTKLLPELLPIVMNGLDSFKRAVKMHFPQVLYVLVTTK